MYGAEYGACEVVFVVMVSDAHVAVAVVVGVRVLAFAHLGLGFVKKHHFAQIFAEFFLLFYGERALFERKMYRLLRIEHAPYEGHELALYQTEKFVVFFGGHTLFVFVQKHVVALQFVGLLPLGIPFIIGDYALQIRLYGREAARSFGLDKF